jgi:uncharacterized protein with HEPN domain
MFRRSDENLFIDIHESICKIEKYIDKNDFEFFSQDEKTVDAVVRNLEIIGEAAQKISEHFKSLNSNIEWRKIIGLRNRIVYEYFGIDLNIIWEVVQTYIPKMKTDIENLIKIGQ